MWIMLPIVGIVVCDLSAVELVQDCSFTSSIETDHTNSHFFHSKKPTDQFGEIQPQFFKFQLNSESISQIPVHLTLSHKLSTLILNWVTRFFLRTWHFIQIQIYQKNTYKILAQLKILLKIWNFIKIQTSTGIINLALNQKATNQIKIKKHSDVKFHTKMWT